MPNIPKPTRRAAMIAGAAGIAVVGAVSVGAAAFADSTPTPSPSSSSSASTGTDQGPGREDRHEPHIGGTVKTIDGSTVTVTDRDGFTRTIHLEDGVTVTKDGADSTVDAITVGEEIHATGSVASDGTTLDATAVMIGHPTRPDGADGRGPGGHGGPKGGERPDGPPAAGAPSSEAPSQAPSAPSGS